MKTCAACHKDLPKDKFSKKQWKLNQRRCKVCIADNREVQPLPPTNNEPNDNGVVSSLLMSMSLQDCNTSISDEELFKQPPTNEDCPICFLRMPTLWSGYKYMVCCGKIICSGCIHAVITNFESPENRDNYVKMDAPLCPFCRTPQATTEKEMIERYKQRVDLNDANAIYNFGTFYYQGANGFSKNRAKALKFYHRAGNLGAISGYYNIGHAYFSGVGVEKDNMKARHYTELAAIRGHAKARYHLGIMENKEGNKERALKHYMIAAGFGCNHSLKQVRALYMDGYATKEEYSTALRLYQTYLDEVKSDQRDAAAAVDDDFKYHE